MSEKKNIKPEVSEQTPEVESRKKAESTEKEEKKPQQAEEVKEKDVVGELTEQLAKEKDSYLRLMAEFETFRRRSSEERLKLVASAAADTIKGLLPVLDDCERAMEILEKSSDEAAKEGTSLIYNKLNDYLEKQGLKRIDAKGQPFDTDFHEAVTQIPAGCEEMKGKVVDVIQTGYTLGGKILRYAKVVVGA